MAKRKTPPRDPKTGRFKKQARRSSRPKRARKNPPRDPKTGQYKTRKRQYARGASNPKPKRQTSPFARKPKKLSEAARFDLESDWVDRYEMSGLLQALAVICDQKAEHFEFSWLAPEKAVPWKQMGHRLRTQARAAEQKGI